MSNPAPAGSPPEVASPAATVTLARSSLATNPLEAFLEVRKILPALEAACGPFASVTRDRVNGGGWSEWKGILGYAVSSETKPEGAEAALLFGEALTLSAEAKAAVLAEGKAKDEAEAVLRAHALAPYGEWANLALENMGEEARPARWLNLYRIELCEGGPEEGGWFFDWREGVASLDISKVGEEEATKALTALAEAMGLTLPALGVRSYRSAAPEQDAEMRLEDVPFASVSTARPRYE